MLDCICITRRSLQRKIIRIVRRPCLFPHLFFCERVPRNFIKFGIRFLYTSCRAFTIFAHIGLVRGIIYLRAQINFCPKSPSLYVDMSEIQRINLLARPLSIDNFHENRCTENHTLRRSINLFFYIFCLLFVFHKIRYLISPFIL